MKESVRIFVMTKKELVDSVKDLAMKFEKIQSNLKLEEKRLEIEKLQKEMESPNFWDDQTKAQKFSQRSGYLSEFVLKWQEMQSGITDFLELIESATEEESAMFEEEFEGLNTKFDQYENELLLSGSHDSGNAILSLHVGNGGQDAEDFTQMLLRMYLRYAEEKGWKVQILDESRSDIGLKSAMIEIQGINVYGFLRSEHGVHRLIRLSPFNAKSLRQTSFTRVEVLPEIENDSEIVIDENDLRVDVFRASGNGGQSVNTTDSAVRITYLPLNLVVTCQNEKSQVQNKQSAMKVLKSRLFKLKEEQKAKELKELRGDMMENSFGSQIRTYTLQPYKLVKDHRTDTEHSNPDKVFDGDLGVFVEAYLRDKGNK